MGEEHGGVKADDIVRQLERTQAQLQRREWELGERVKELHCLYDVGVLLDRAGADVSLTLQAVVDRLPAGWQFPDRMAARLRIGQRQFQTGNWVEPMLDPAWTQRAPLDCVEGMLEVSFVEVPPDRVAPFLPEEAPLIAALASRIGEAVQRRHAERDLEEREAYFRSLIEDATDWMRIVDVDGTVRYSSSASTSIIGLTPEQVVGCNGFDLVHPDDVERVRSAVADALETGQSSLCGVEYRIEHADGHWRWVESDARFRMDHPVIGGIVLHTRDVTEQRRLREQLLQAQKLEIVGRLTGGVAHDFNNLLTVIEASTGLLLFDEAPPERQNEIEQIRDAGRQAAALTRRLLAFSRHQKSHPRALDLKEVLGGIERLLDRIIGEDVRLEMVVRAEAVWASRSQIEQILLNLAINARDAMPLGGELRIEAVPAGPAHTDMIDLRVSDVGSGMEPAIQARVFEPFFTTKAEGTGLGLATVRDLVTDLRGGLELESRPGQGTTITVRLPAAEPESGPWMAQSEPQRTMRGETVLVVEDDDGVRTIVRRILELYGYRVITASDGDVALERARQHAGLLDLLLCDLVLPTATGPAVVERVTALQPQAAVLYISGYTADVLTRHGLQPGEVDLLEKPFTARGLVWAVQRALGGPMAEPGRR